VVKASKTTRVLFVLREFGVFAVYGGHVGMGMGGREKSERGKLLYASMSALFHPSTKHQ
jgi:hypothetical protein